MGVGGRDGERDSIFVSASLFFFAPATRGAIASEARRYLRSGNAPATRKLPYERNVSGANERAWILFACIDTPFFPSFSRTPASSKISEIFRNFWKSHPRPSMFPYCPQRTPSRFFLGFFFRLVCRGFHNYLAPVASLKGGVNGPAPAGRAPQLPTMSQCIDP